MIFVDYTIANKINYPKPYHNIILWLDSTDFQIKRKRSAYKNKSIQAKKLSFPSQRWLTIVNSNGQIQWIRGPHCPNEYNGNLILYYGKKIAKSFLLITIIADCQFMKAAPFLKKVKLITPKSNAERPKMVKDKKVLYQLIEEEERVNEIITGV